MKIFTREKSVRRLFIWIILVLMTISLISCEGLVNELSKTQTEEGVQAYISQNTEENSVKPTQTKEIVPTVTLSAPSITAAVNDISEIDERDPENWKEWPVLPQGVSTALKEIYQQGLTQGNDPHAFSILGDCHSLPEIFLGVYDSDPEVVAQLDEDLQETVSQFQGSFDRYSPTVATGTTEGALLWWRWNENLEGYCETDETPIDCELRYHKPSIAFIRIGTHYEARNEDYLRTIIEKLLENGTVPVIVTKADNRELDERVNQNLAKLAVEYDLPCWNFWASVQDLPGKGLNEESEMYLSDEAYALQKIEGLQVLDIVYRALQP